MQTLDYPWKYSDWSTTKDKITNKVTSLMEIDTLLVNLSRNSIRSRSVYELFNKYYDDNNWNPTLLHERVPLDKFLNEIFPWMQNLIYLGQRTFHNIPEIPLLTPDNPASIILSQHQVVTLISCIWFCVFDYDYVSSGHYTSEDFPIPTFNNIFNSNGLFSLQCLMGYFNKAYLNRDVSRNIIFKRITKELDPAVAQSTAPVRLNVSSGGPSPRLTLINTSGLFDCSFGQDLKEAECMLLTHPETIPIVLFCSELTDTSTVAVIGAECVSKWTGLGSNIEYSGKPCADLAPQGFRVMLPSALVYSRSYTPAQARIDTFLHNISKLYRPASLIPLRCTFKVGIVGWNIHDQKTLLELLLAISASNNTLVIPHGGSQQLLDITKWISTVNITVNELVCVYKEVIRLGPSNSPDLFNRIIELQI